MSSFRSCPMTTRRALLLLIATFLFCSPAFAQSQVDLSIQKTGPASAAPNSDVTFQIVATNQGPDVAVNATVKDILPAGVTFVSLSSPSGWDYTSAMTALEVHKKKAGEALPQASP